MSDNEHPVDSMPLDEKASDDRSAGVMSALQALESRIDKLESNLLARQRESNLQLYRQFEAFHWLTQRLSIKGRLPPLRGWPLSPDILLELHETVSANRPGLIVEFGSGSSTLVIADALAQIGQGRLVSFEHSPHYAEETRRSLEREGLLEWVDLRVGELAPWQGAHLAFETEEGAKSTIGDESVPHWYPVPLLEDLDAIDFVLVDGPPAGTCRFARYPALPALAGKLASGCSVWLDDAGRWEEKKIIEAWAEHQAATVEQRPMEKGLAIVAFDDAP